MSRCYECGSCSVSVNPSGLPNSWACDECGETWYAEACLSEPMLQQELVARDAPDSTRYIDAWIYGVDYAVVADWSPSGKV